MSETTRVAVISAVAALIGAFVGLIGASIPAYIQASSNKQIEADKFSREQRLAAYLNFYGALADESATASRRKLDTGEALSDSEIGELRRSVNAVQVARDRISIVGSEEAKAAALRVYETRLDLARAPDSFDLNRRYSSDLEGFGIASRRDLQSLN